MGTALPNFGTRANNIGHGPLDFCRVKANFSARVLKNLGGPRPPQEVVSARLKRGLLAETRNILVPRAFALMNDHETEGSGVENEPSGRQSLVLFAGRKMASKNRGKICIWSNDTRDMLIDLWLEESIQFALENSKISQETREVLQHVTGNCYSSRRFGVTGFPHWSVLSRYLITNLMENVLKCSTSYS